MNHMVPVVFLDDIHDTKNLKEFVRYIAQLRLPADRIRQCMSEAAERKRRGGRREGEGGREKEREREGGREAPFWVKEECQLW